MKRPLAAALGAGLLAAATALPAAADTVTGKVVEYTPTRLVVERAGHRYPLRLTVRTQIRGEVRKGQRAIVVFEEKSKIVSRVTSLAEEED